MHHAPGLFTFLPFYFFIFLPLKAAAASYTECGSDSCEKGDCNLQNCFPGTCFHNLYFFNVKCLMLIGWGAPPLDAREKRTPARR